MSECVRVLEGHEKTIRSIKLCGRRIISGCWSGKTKIWNLKNALEGKEKDKVCIQTIHKHTDWVQGLYADTESMVTASIDGTIAIFDFSYASNMVPR